jgi:hypothetical protein
MRATLLRFSIAVLLLGLTQCSPAGSSPNPGGGGSSSAGQGQGGGSTSGGKAGAGGSPVSNTGGSGNSGNSGNSTTAGQGGSMAGGSAGSPAGGNAGSAGSSAGGNAGSAGSSASAGASCDGADIFCADFEADAIPAEMLFWPEYLRATQTFISIDKTLAHTGQGALKVVGTDYSQMLGVTVPNKFWGRVYLRSDTDIQAGHNTYVAAGTSTGDPNMGTYIRIGEHQCQLELNRNTDDKELLSNGGTYMCEGGVKLLKDTWYCLEFLYDGPGQEIRVFVDDEEITALHATAWGVNEYQVFKLGFEKYHGMNKTLWYDNLALGSAQIGCLSD